MYIYIYIQREREREREREITSPSRGTFPSAAEGCGPGKDRSRHPPRNHAYGGRALRQLCRAIYDITDV